MKSTIVDKDGDVRCPKCGARNSFITKRTAKGKMTMGIAAPKRIKCNGCGTNLKRATPAPAYRPPTKARAPSPLVKMDVPAPFSPLG
jgi:hypothetical protein